MKVWRICKRNYVPTAFEGIGAKKAGGRWNSRGRAVVYCSESLALAALEVLVHLNIDQQPPNMVAIPATLPDQLRAEAFEAKELPDGWRRVTGHSEVIQRGDTWIDDQRSLTLHVPSVVIPEATNVLLNPDHPDFASVDIGDPRPFSFDDRLFAI